MNISFYSNHILIENENNHPLDFSISPRTTNPYSSELGEHWGELYEINEESTRLKPLHSSYKIYNPIDESTKKSSSNLNSSAHSIPFQTQYPVTFSPICPRCLQPDDEHSGPITYEIFMELQQQEQSRRTCSCSKKIPSSQHSIDNDATTEVSIEYQIYPETRSLIPIEDMNPSSVSKCRSSSPTFLSKTRENKNFKCKQQKQSQRIYSCNKQITSSQYSFDDDTTGDRIGYQTYTVTTSLLPVEDRNPSSAILPWKTKQTSKGKKSRTKPLHKCPYSGCIKAYHKIRQLRTHAATHTCIKAFTCDWPGCAKRSLHYRQHTGEKRYCCEHYDLAFSRSDHLRKI